MVKKLTNTEKMLTAIIIVLVAVIGIYLLSIGLENFNNRRVGFEVKKFYGENVTEVFDNVSTSQEYLKVLSDKTKSDTIEGMIVTMLQQTNNCSTSKIMFGNFSRNLLDSECALQAINNAYLQAISELYIATQNCSVATITVGNLTREVVDVNCIGQ